MPQARMCHIITTCTTLKTIVKCVVCLFLAFLGGKTIASNGEVRNCEKKPPYLPKTVVSTTDRLEKLRAEMKKQSITAYIIPSADAHGSEYVRKRDKRRQFISGFSGSAGTAIVTLDKAALWTDGRYFLQADMQLDCNWILQKYGKKGVPSQSGWLKQVLGENDAVGIDPFLISAGTWDNEVAEFKDNNITLKGVKNNLVDIVWTNRPALEAKVVHVQPFKYTGKYWWDKVKDVQKKMKEAKATAHIVQALDAVAWLLNLRGEDIPYNPVFFAYVVVKENETLFFVDSSKISSGDVQKHLKLSDCPKKESYCIKTMNYDSIQSELITISKADGAKIWSSPLDSQALRMDVPKEKIYSEYSPISLMKAKKNEVELQGMKNANLKDSVALAEFFLWTEKQIAAKAENITELRLGEKMIEFRSKQALYKGLSFPSIIGFGANGAIIHYTASKETNKEVTDQSTLLVDTGSQYSDGTTDVTRTVHFGTPTSEQKSAFTRVLIGHIDLGTAVFPEGTYGPILDIFAREALYKNGWDYQHGTGHGIGSFLFIHEGPGRTFFGKVNKGFPPPDEAPLEMGFVLSDEPGFYVNGNFGIRIETAFMVINASTPNRFNDVDYYTFEPIGFFPIQRKLIDENLMTKRQIKWLNDYHKKTRDFVGPELIKQKKNEAYDWLIRETQPIGTVKAAARNLTAWSSCFIFIIAIIITQL